MMATSSLTSSFMCSAAGLAAPTPTAAVGQVDAPAPASERAAASKVGSKALKGSKEQTRLRCPHCACPCFVRSSEQATVLTRVSMHSCSNPECGHTFVAITEIVRTLSPSATPNPSVCLPLSSHVRRDLLRATVEHAATAEHEPRFTKAVTGDLFTAAGPPD